MTMMSETRYGIAKTALIYNTVQPTHVGSISNVKSAIACLHINCVMENMIA